MESLHELIPYGFAGAGVWLAVLHPLSGLGIVATGLAYGAVRRFIEQNDTKRATEAIAGLQFVVNANAAKLENLILEHEKIATEHSFQQNAKAMGIGIR